MIARSGQGALYYSAVLDQKVRVNPILAQGAAFGRVTMVDRFDGDVTDLIRTGDRLRIDAAAGVVEILDRN